MMNKRFIPFLLIAFLFTFSNSTQAQYYWVGGAGDWSDYANHWATSSGGNTFHTETPTQDDDVFFDANSFTESGQTVTLDLPENICNSMDWTGVQFFPSMVCDFWDDLWIYGSVNFAADVTYNLAEIRLMSPNTGNTITSNGSYLGSSSSIRKYGDGEYSLVDNLSCNDFYLLDGTFDTNDQDMNIDFAVRIEGEFGRTMIMGNSNIYAQQWRTLGSNAVIIPETSTIHVSSMYPDESGTGPYTYNNLTFIENGGLIYGSGIFNEIDATGTGGDVLRFKGGITVTCNQFVLNGTSTSPTEMLLGTGTGHATIEQSSGSVDVSYVIMSDIHATGGATFNVNPGIDNGNNDGWNFTAIVPQNYFWVGNGGDWEDLSHWATSSGGAINHDVLPSQFDDVFFDANSVSTTGQTITINEPARFRHMDWTGIQNDPYFYAGYQDNLYSYGDFILTEDLNKNLYGLSFLGDESDILIGNIGAVNYPTFWGGGVYSLMSDVNCSSFAMYDGTVNTNGYTITCAFDFKEGNSNNNVYNLGSSEIFCRNFEVQSSNATINAGTSTIHVRQDFKGKGNDYYHLVLEEEGSIFQSNTFQTLEFEPGVLSQLEASSTQTVLGEIIINGTSSMQINISSTEEGIQGTFSKSSGTVNATFVSLKDNNATGGATFNANQAIDNGNNTGWNITEVVPQDFYWVGGTGDWSDAANHWATSSGGSTFFSYAPGPLDDVYFDGNSFNAADQVVTIDLETINFFDMDWTGVTNNPTFSGSQKTMNIFGSLTWVENMTANVKNFNFLGEGSHTIDPGYAGSPGNNAYFLFNSGGTWDLQAELFVRELNLQGGTVNTNENEVHVDFATYFNGYNSKTLNIGSQEYYSRIMEWQGMGENLTINGPNSNLVVSSSFSPDSGNDDNVVLNLNNLHFTFESGMDIASIYGELFLNTLSIDPGKELRIHSSFDVTVEQLIAQGNDGEVIIIKGMNEGIQSTIIQESGTVNGEYLDLKDISGTGGATFYANNSINSGNVSGWIFTGQAQTIDFPFLDDVMEDVGTINLSATASSGLDVTFSLVSGPATLDGNVLTITGPGSVQVQASQVGDLEFSPAASVTNTFCSTPLQPSISGVITDSALLTSSSTSGNQWFFNGVEIDGATEQDYEGLGNGTYTVQVIVDGCSSEISDTFEVTELNDLQNQTIDFPVIDDVLEDVGTINLTATASSGLSVSYSVISGPATVNGAVLTITGPGSVEVQAAQAGDADFNPATSVSNTFCSNPLQPSITGVIAETALLSSSSSMGNQWFFNGSEINGAENQDYEGTSNGTYTVQVSVDGCVSEMSGDYDVTGLSISELSRIQNLELYPNPSNGIVNLELEFNDRAIYNVYDLSGKLILNGEVDHGDKTIDLSSTEAGLYIIVLDVNGSIYQTRVIKE